ncbi:VOC family protein [Devosia sp. ZB163]|uniref:VOC family protein n=1 Tax=Devosia sp. ZB163 TaxID=3025938 RepID=UPI00235DEF67|nr:VOC family protein [Devosia sp. ZB163]MDC9822455.1 VOC family protein [Devosia sp. ZB163]
MAGLLKEIVFDCHRAAPLARFWAGLLEGYAVRAYDDEEIARLAALGFTPETDPVVMVDGPGPTLCFHEIERGRVQGRIHLDVKVVDRNVEKARLLALGASVVREAEGYTVMADPEGNHFCLVD